MLQQIQHETVEEASRDLLTFALAPENWVSLETPDPSLPNQGLPKDWPAYCRTVDALRIRASVDVTHSLEVLLHVAFRGPTLTPMKAAEYLEGFLNLRFPLVPNTEWEVEVDGRRWIHFRRKYTGELLKA